MNLSEFYNKIIFRNMTFRPSFFTPNTVSSVVVQRPITTKNDNKKNEIFVDIFEKISVLIIFLLISDK